MAAQALPPPQGGQPDNPTSPSPGGGFPSPAPPQPNQKAAQQLDLVRNIVSSTRLLGNMLPGAVPIVRQINDLVQELQKKIVASQGAPEPQAPPV